MKNGLKSEKKNEQQKLKSQKNLGHSSMFPTSDETHNNTRSAQGTWSVLFGTVWS